MCLCQCDCIFGKSSLSKNFDTSILCYLCYYQIYLLKILISSSLSWELPRWPSGLSVRFVGRTTTDQKSLKLVVVSFPLGDHDYGDSTMAGPPVSA